MGFTSYEVDNDKEFRKALDRAQKKVRNLTIPLTLIAKDFYKSEKAIFQLKSAGRYPDLSTKPFRALWQNENEYGHLYEGGYKEYKQVNYGFTYPILKASGRLEKSLTDPSSPEAVNQIINQRSLVIGSTVPYLVYHQSDKPRKKIPLRKPLFIGPESKFAGSEQKGRPLRWQSILSSFILKKTGEEL